MKTANQLYYNHNLFNCNQQPKKWNCEQKTYLALCFSSHPDLCLCILILSPTVFYSTLIRLQKIDFFFSGVRTVVCFFHKYLRSFFMYHKPEVFAKVTGLNRSIYKSSVCKLRHFCMALHDILETRKYLILKIDTGYCQFYKRVKILVTESYLLFQDWKNHFFLMELNLWIGIDGILL